VSTWRERARPVIARVLRENKGQDEKVIGKALKDAYPWGERKYQPYKMWLDEIRRQRGLKPTKPKKVESPDPRQQELFDDEDG